MGYCVVEDVRSICDTDMTDGEIDVMIDVISAMMATLVSTTNATILRGICMTWSAYRCMLKDPNARSLGEYSERRDVALEHLKSQLDDMLVTGSGTSGGVKVIATMEGL